jgi:hypothetical protein
MVGDIHITTFLLHSNPRSFSADLPRFITIPTTKTRRQGHRHPTPHNQQANHNRHNTKHPPKTPHQQLPSSNKEGHAPRQDDKERTTTDTTGPLRDAAPHTARE